MDIKALERICMARYKAKCLFNHSEEISIVSKTFERKENMENNIHVFPTHIRYLYLDCKRD